MNLARFGTSLLPETRHTLTGIAGPSRVVRWLLLLVTALGVLHIAFLPPWEGYDETAHWSYIQELADTGSSPHEGRDTLSGDVDRYEGPMHYGDTVDKGHITYQLARTRRLPAVEAGPSSYSPGRDINWEAQHPPLYYLLMAPLYRVSSDWSWKYSLALLRIASWTFAVSGLALASFATLRIGPKFERAAIATSAWPLIAPEFFPEMARVGNDSLCLLILSIIWVFLLQSLYGRPHRLSPVFIGCAVGAGLLTKAFFIPLGVGATLLVIASAWRNSPRHAIAQGATISVVACAIGLWWYVLKFQETGTMGGGHEFILLHRTGGLISGLEKHFSLRQLLWGLLGLPLTFTWPKTWSYVSPHGWQFVFLSLFCLVPLLNWLRNIRRSGIGANSPAFFIVPLLAGLVYHIFACIAVYGSGKITPGWYLHVIAPPLAFAWSIGWTGSVIELGIAVFAIASAIPLWLIQLSLFSGCAAPDGSGHMMWPLRGCFIDLDELRTLGVLWLALLAAPAILIATAMLRPHQVGVFLTRNRKILPGRPVVPMAPELNTV